MYFIWQSMFKITYKYLAYCIWFPKLLRINCDFRLNSRQGQSTSRKSHSNLFCGPLSFFVTWKSKQFKSIETSLDKNWTYLFSISIKKTKKVVVRQSANRQSADTITLNRQSADRQSANRQSADYVKATIRRQDNPPTRQFADKKYINHLNISMNPYS